VASQHKHPIKIRVSPPSLIFDVPFPIFDVPFSIGMEPFLPCPLLPCCFCENRGEMS